jgi:hypothetical protein
MAIIAPCSKAFAMIGNWFLFIRKVLAKSTPKEPLKWIFLSVTLKKCWTIILKSNKNIDNFTSMSLFTNSLEGILANSSCKGLLWLNITGL